MAISVSNWVWDHSRSRHAARLVLLALADCARETGVAWPSVAELKRKTGLGERAVQTALIDLAKLGELEIGYQQGPKGCNRYRLLMGRNPAKSAGAQSLRGAKSADPQDSRGSESSQVNGHDPAGSAPPQNMHPADPAPDPANFAGGTVKEPSKNSSTKSSTSPSGVATGSLFGDDDPAAEATPKKWTAVTIKPLFAEWYAVYPVHKERAAAETAYLKVVNKGADPAILLAAAKSYRNDIHVLAGFPKNPATWLNKGCWTDEPTPQPPAAGRNGSGPKQADYTDEEHQRGFRRPTGA